MQNPSEDTQWNDALRRHGILPEKEVSEDQLIDLVEETVQQKTGNVVKAYEDMTLEELEELEDEEDERVLLQYRSCELKGQLKIMSGTAEHVLRLKKYDYYFLKNMHLTVISSLTWQSVPLCTLVNQFLTRLAEKFPTTKFLKSVSTTCIPNYPDRHLPTIFIYCEEDMKKQFVGPFAFGGMNLKIEELEWMLAEAGAVKTDLEEDPRKKNKVHDVMTSSLQQMNAKDSDSDDDDDDE
ncbi:phosducin-like protein 3 [Pocillopora damicornis]|uniref:phosducin-like protein 3 n=1 Tax=Pocillopora damicornis TaxID=46731 RepID=UPI000F553AFC|nr:phosducin-like protein 3 [Pocillopora damicornis]